MKNVMSYSVRPTVPEELSSLERIAFNLLWCWDREAIDLLRSLDEELWEESLHNPVMMLNKISQERFREISVDEALVEHLHRVDERFSRYLGAKNTWFRKLWSSDTPLIAYFSAEWGLTECIKIYSGGLGILAGDTIKSASDLGLPIAGVGLLYQEGYFRQYLNVDGWQQETRADNDFFNLPVRAQTDQQGNPITVALDLCGRRILVRCWTVDVGRAVLYLLDTNIPENSPDDRNITSRLYGGDADMRIRQEIVLGVGGTRILKAIGLEPVIYHMNEGHSALLAVERIRQLMKGHGLSFAEAREVARRTNVFTTHTPVPAGIDEFPSGLMEKYFRDYAAELGVPIQQLIGMGRVVPEESAAPFNMARFAIREAAYVNGVSRLHRDVSRKMWQDMWQHVPSDELPIDYVTNGIHIPSWVSRDMAELLDRYLGSGWVDRPTDEKVWNHVWRIPDAELWRTHERRRERLVAFARRCLCRQLRDQGACRETIQRAEEVLDPCALTIGFARRFAPYKRATLLLRDPDRLKRILTDPDRPVQLVFAGKAHPNDRHGKELIRQIIHFARRENLGNHVVFIEDYNMIVSRYLVEGVDVWLNTPLRPMEASGTSGMKVVPNGGLNISVLDGWWDEAYTSEVGWAIGRGETYEDGEYQDQVESSALYDLLEREVIPLFYSRSRDDLPRGWITMVKNSMRGLCHTFNTDRMVKEYTRKFYLPALEEYSRLRKDDFRGVREFVTWKARLHSEWPSIEIVSAKVELNGDEMAGCRVPITARIRLGHLTPEDVTVEAYYGRLDTRREIVNGSTLEMMPEGESEDMILRYTAKVPCEEGGRHGATIRVLPSRKRISDPISLGLIKWL
jgi:starch phosphorylase